VYDFEGLVDFSRRSFSFAAASPRLWAVTTAGTARSAAKTTGAIRVMDASFDNGRL
jgi:hypothetical protein